MTNFLHFLRLCVLLLFSIILFSCTASKELSDRNFHPVTVDAEEIISNIPDYSAKLHSVRGRGRAIVSEPGNTERVTLLFSSNRKKSLVTIRNGIGIEGGQLLTDGDTLLIYNKIDKYARKIPVRGSNLEHINRLASLNILDMMSYSISGGEVKKIMENEERFMLQLTDGAEVYIDKESFLVKKVIQPEGAELPYSKIVYDAYASLSGLKLPRRITIFGADKKSKIALLLTSLDLNPKLDSLAINLPDNIPVYYR